LFAATCATLWSGTHIREIFASEVGAYAVFDGSDERVVRVLVVSEPNDENYPVYLDQLAREFRARDQYGLLFDTGELSKFPARYRAMQERWLADTEEEFQGHWLCGAFVIKHRVIRGVLASMYWLNPPYYAAKVVADRAAGEEWIKKEFGTFTSS
jgi:hypothetical protein